MKNLNSHNQSTIAFFDFDNTITTKDSFLAFLKYTHGLGGIFNRFLYLWPIILLYKFRLISNSLAKKIVFGSFYRNWQLDIFQDKTINFCTTILPTILNCVAMKKLCSHRQQGHKVIIITAMFDLILQPWCKENNLELIATGLEIKNGCLTGNFSTPNCYGKEKLNRIISAGLLKNAIYIVAYGDSRGDKEMLAQANEAFYRPF